MIRNTQPVQATFQNGIRKRPISIIFRALKLSNRFKQRSIKASENVQFLSISDSVTNSKCNQSLAATFQKASKNVQFLSLFDY